MVDVNVWKNSNIAILIDDYWSLGGTQSFARNFQKLLNDRNVNCKIISVKGCSKGGVQGLNYKSNISTLLNPFCLYVALKQFDYVIVVSGQLTIYTFFWLHGDRVIHRESNRPKYRIAEQKGIKKIVQAILFKIMEYLSSRLIVVCPSEQCAKDFKNFKNINVITNFIEYIGAEKISHVYNKEDKKIGYVGRPTYAKGYDRVSELASELLDYDVLHFGPSINDISRVVKVGVERNKQIIFNNIDFLVLLSRTEGFPNVVNEAIQFGLPIIVSNELRWLQDIPHIKRNIAFCGELQEVIEFFKTLKRTPCLKLLQKPQIDKINNWILNQYIRLVEEKNNEKFYK